MDGQRWLVFNNRDSISMTILTIICILLLLNWITSREVFSINSNNGEENLFRINACLNNSSPNKQNEQPRILFELWNRLLKDDGNFSSATPHAPHIQNCNKCSLEFSKLDSRMENGSRPPWTLWRGSLGVNLGGGLPVEDASEEMLGDQKALVQGPNTPWVVGGDGDNIPLTRRVQRDIWLHQHPRNCSNAKFLLADWRTSMITSSIGVGAEIVAMVGLLALAMNEGRVLVTKDYHGANHSGCLGPNHSRWSCYFFPEASSDCIARALQLSSEESAWREGLITNSKSYSSNVEFWLEVPIPKMWGKPWEYIGSTVELDGAFIGDYGQDRRWWRAQGFRYLMRYPSNYLCRLANQARHEAFGLKAAELVASSLPNDWPQVPHFNRTDTPIEKLVWNSFGPWVPRPLVSVHVRQGDKDVDMKVFAFKDYMTLANRIQQAFPDARNIWLSTEMQTVVEESKNYTPRWNFHYTKVTRQTGSKSMALYMKELGKKAAFDNSFVNLMLASESDFFIGVLGSTWSYLIDCLRVTSGKVMSGFLTLNPISVYL